MSSAIDPALVIESFDTLASRPVIWLIGDIGEVAESAGIMALEDVGSRSDCWRLRTAAMKLA
jgi:hypothetical protein